MEEAITTVASVSNMTSEYVDYGENINHSCFVLLELKAMAVVCMGISLCGLVGNSLVVWLLVFHVKWNTVSTYTRNLAIFDFFLLLLVFLLMLAVLSFSTFCFYNLISLYLSLVLLGTIICQFFDLNRLCLLTAISVEQGMAVLFPTWYHHRYPKQCSHITYLMILVLVGLFFFLRYLSFNFARTYEAAYPGVAIAICIILSSLMLASNLALFIKLQCGSQGKPPGKLDIAVLLSMIFSFVLGIPFTVEIFLYLPHSYALFPETRSMTSFLLASLNSSIKPVLYFLLGSCQQCHLQYSIKVAYQRVFEEEATSEKSCQVPGDAEAETSV